MFERKHIAYGLLVTAAIATSTQAFTSSVRREIIDRDGRKCRECGSTEHLEAAHINHDKRRKRYNAPSNGRTLCTLHHLEDHIQRHGRNGLSKDGNSWAVKQLRRRATRYGMLP